MYGSIKSFRTYNVVRIIKRKEYDMARCKFKKSGCCTKIVSDIVSNMPNGCFDVCTNPICGSPSELSLFAPLIYDQIGINLCAVAAAGVDRIYQLIIQLLPTQQQVLLKYHISMAQVTL